MKVTLAYRYTDADGKRHEPDKTITVADDIGTQLIHDGKARAAESSSTTTATKEG